jgi:hypothetical protein
MIYATFVMTFKQCAQGLTVKLAGGKLNLSGENPNFDVVIGCIKQNSPIPVEYKMA